MSNATPPTPETVSEATGGTASAVRPRRRLWMSMVVAGVLLAAALATVGGEVAVALTETMRMVVGGGRLYWSDDEHGWTELPLALRLRRHWGEADHVLDVDWREAMPGLDVGEFSILHPPDPRSVPVVVVSVDPRRFQFRVFGRADWKRGTVRELGAEAELVFAVNGPYFAGDGPLGLVVSDGVSRNRQGSRRAAHFLVHEPGTLPRIVNERGADVGGVREGFQGFPAIMSDRKTYSYMRNGGRGFDVEVADRRTAACTTSAGRVLFLATDLWTGGLSLSELATILGALGCVDAMGFDGGASTGMWLKTEEESVDVRGLDDVPVILGVVPRG